MLVLKNNPEKLLESNKNINDIRNLIDEGKINSEEYSVFTKFLEDHFPSLSPKLKICMWAAKLENKFINSVLNQMQELNKLPEFENTTIRTWHNITNNFHLSEHLTRHLVLIYYNLLQLLSITNGCSILAFVIVQRGKKISIIVSHDSKSYLGLEESQNDIVKLKKRINAINGRLVKPKNLADANCIKIEFEV